jgi:hypothetical protein
MSAIRTLSYNLIVSCFKEYKNDVLAVQVMKTFILIRGPWSLINMTDRTPSKIYFGKESNI